MQARVVCGRSAAALQAAGNARTWLFRRISRSNRVSAWGSYGRPRMTGELKEIGLEIGHPLPGNGLHGKP